MLPVAVFSARLARRNLDIISTSTSLLDSLRRFLLLSAAGALDDEEFFILRAPCKLVSATGMTLVLWTYTHLKTLQNNNNRLRQVGDPFLCALLVMDELSGQPNGGVARRRRERRMRSWFRHGMALATVLHPSYDRVHAHRVRRSTEPEHSHQGQGRGSERREELHGEVLEDSSSPGVLPAVRRGRRRVGGAAWVGL